MRTRRSGGYTIISALTTIAILGLISIAVFSAINSLMQGSLTYRERVVISALADQYLEIARNMSYSTIGTLNGNPHGILPDLPNAKTVTVNGTTYLIYYVVSYVDDPSDGTIALGTDPAPTDYKQVKLYIKNTKTGALTPFVTNIVPKGLEGLASGGALSVKVFDAVGVPVPNATLTITNALVTPSINLTRTTDASGNWIEVGLPNSVNGYHIVATKSGYSSDQTYPSTMQNPNPIKPDVTISNGAVTALSFGIDHTSAVTFNVVNQLCQPISGIPFELRGSKLVGTSPNVLKFDNTYTSDSRGQILLPLLEWDTYIPSINAPLYSVYGSSPIQQISVLPNTSQQSTFILGPSTPNSLLVIVKDQSTGQPIENATVELLSASFSYDSTKYTEGSVWNQSDWSGGSGQADFTDHTRYYQDDANVDVATLPTALRLKQFGGVYNPSGTLESSTFDTGTASTTYTTIGWDPQSQTASTSVSFQVAANNDDATWNYIGPDGTASTYYTVPGSSMSAALGNNRYVRYKAYLSTMSTSTTPAISNVSLNYVAGCAAPGQAMFADPSSGSGYQLTVSMSGYTTKIIPNITINGYNVLEVNLQ